MLLFKFYGGHGVVVSMRICGILGTGSNPVGHPKEIGTDKSRFNQRFFAVD